MRAGAGAGAGAGAHVFVSGCGSGCLRAGVGAHVHGIGVRSGVVTLWSQGWADGPSNNNLTCLVPWSGDEGPINDTNGTDNFPAIAL